MRLPGFYNHKYAKPHYVRVEHRSDAIYTPEHFPQASAEERAARSASAPRGSSAVVSQSERDFAYAIRALRRAIAKHRSGEKSDLAAYAGLTVRKAADSIAVEGEPIER